MAGHDRRAVGKQAGGQCNGAAARRGACLPWLQLIGGDFVYGGHKHRQMALKQIIKKQSLLCAERAAIYFCVFGRRAGLLGEKAAFLGNEEGGGDVEKD